MSPTPKKPLRLWGVTTQRVHAWARDQDGGSELTGTPASPGAVEGLARVVKGARNIVCSLRTCFLFRT